MFDVNGQLYWPVAPPNPEIHPFWTPEFVGDIFTVNGKSWPYLSVAPRKYRFRLLDGCNARWLNLWLVNAVDGSPGPAFTVVGGDGGLLATPVTKDPAIGDSLLIGPGQRYDIVIDFTNYAGGKYILMNDAGAPYPDGTPVAPGTTDRIMQFVVNGVAVTPDNSQVPSILRPVNPLVAYRLQRAYRLLRVKRQIILNEVMAAGGPPRCR
jgi:FtsP/CotA-like multicopper oxidase with cupredoxin domain